MQNTWNSEVLDRDDDGEAISDRQGYAIISFHIILLL